MQVRMVPWGQTWFKKVNGNIKCFKRRLNMIMWVTIHRTYWMKISNEHFSGRSTMCAFHFSYIEIIIRRSAQVKISAYSEYSLAIFTLFSSLEVSLRLCIMNDEIMNRKYIQRSIFQTWSFDIHSFFSQDWRFGPVVSLL